MTLRDYPHAPAFVLSRRYSPFARAGAERTLCGRDAYPDQSGVYLGAKGAWRRGDRPEPWGKRIVGQSLAAKLPSKGYRTENRPGTGIRPAGDKAARARPTEGPAPGLLLLPV